MNPSKRGARAQVSEALVAELGRRVDMGVPVSILRELGSQEYQAKLLEAQAKVAPCKCSRSHRLAGK